jgi:hypothetical protein
MNSQPLVLNQPFSEVFRTDRLPLASFLHATGKLRFVGGQANGGRVVFCFADPQGIAAEVELEFERGASCPATALFASQKFLRREVDKFRDTENRGYGRSNS